MTFVLGVDLISITEFPSNKEREVKHSTKSKDNVFIACSNLRPYPRTFVCLGPIRVYVRSPDDQITSTNSVESLLLDKVWSVDTIYLYTFCTYIYITKRVKVLTHQSLTVGQMGYFKSRKTKGGIDDV